MNWNGTEKIILQDGTERKFLEDGDEIIIKGSCALEGNEKTIRIGFGECKGKILPAQ